MSLEQKSLKQIMEFRVEKLDSLIKNGINPYPSKFEPSNSSSQILSDYAKFEEKKVIIVNGFSR